MLFQQWSKFSVLNCVALRIDFYSHFLIKGHNTLSQALCFSGHVGKKDKVNDAIFHWIPLTGTLRLRGEKQSNTQIMLGLFMRVSIKNMQPWYHQLKIGSTWLKLRPTALTVFMRNYQALTLDFLLMPTAKTLNKNTAWNSASFQNSP